MPWYADWFGEEYLALYPHRDAAEAERLMALIGRCTAWHAGWRVLDIGCGPGRHAAALESAGIRPVGLDLSMTLLRRARQVTAAPLVRADMRHLPVRAATMDMSLSLFTSFGYFESDDEHRATLRGMVSTVRRGGWFVLDFLNAEQVRGHVPASPGEFATGAMGSAVRKYLSPNDQHVIKEIRLADGREFMERVRLLGAPALESMLRAAGAEVRHAFGDYSGGPLSPTAPRVLLLAVVT